MSEAIGAMQFRVQHLTNVETYDILRGVRINHKREQSVSKLVVKLTASQRRAIAAQCIAEIVSDHVPESVKKEIVEVYEDRELFGDVPMYEAVGLELRLQLHYGETQMEIADGPGKEADAQASPIIDRTEMRAKIAGGTRGKG